MVRQLTKSIKISEETKERLTQRKQGNDTYDDVITAALDQSEPEE